MPSSKKYPGLYYGNPKTSERKNFYFKLNNFQLFKKDDSSINTDRKRDLVVACDLSCNINEAKSKNKIKVYCKGKSYNIDFNIKKKKAIGGKHYSYERYLAKKKGCFVNKMNKMNENYYNNNKHSLSFKNKLHNPCSWESINYSKNLIYTNIPRDKKNIFNKHPLPNGKAGAKNCSIYNCPKYI